MSIQPRMPSVPAGDHCVALWASPGRHVAALGRRPSSCPPQRPSAASNNRGPADPAGSGPQHGLRSGPQQQHPPEGAKHVLHRRVGHVRQPADPRAVDLDDVELVATWETSKGSSTEARQAQGLQEGCRRFSGGPQARRTSPPDRSKAVIVCPASPHFQQFPCHAPGSPCLRNSTDVVSGCHTWNPTRDHIPGDEHVQRSHHEERPLAVVPQRRCGAPLQLPQQHGVLLPVQVQSDGRGTQLMDGRCTGLAEERFRQARGAAGTVAGGGEQGFLNTLSREPAATCIDGARRKVRHEVAMTRRTRGGVC
jgi:hypothetical protein